MSNSKFEIWNFGPISHVALTQHCWWHERDRGSVGRCSVGCLGSHVLLHSSFTPLGPSWLSFLPEFWRVHAQQLFFVQEQLWGSALMSGYYHRFSHFGYLGEICLLFYPSETMLKRPLCKARHTALPEIWCFPPIQSLLCLFNRKGFGFYKVKH